MKRPKLTLQSPTCVEFFELAAEKGHVDSLLMLGILYHFGRMGLKDEKKGKELIRRAAKEGSAMAAMFYAQLSWKAGDTPEAREATSYLQFHANRGVVSCLGNLGLRYYFGDGVAQDKEMAVRLLQIPTFLLSETILPIEYYCLGSLYHEGIFGNRPGSVTDIYKQGTLFIENAEKMAPNFYEAFASDNSPSISSSIFWKNSEYHKLHNRITCSTASQEEASFVFLQAVLQGSSFQKGLLNVGLRLFLGPGVDTLDVRERTVSILEDISELTMLPNLRAAALMMLGDAYCQGFSHGSQPYHKAVEAFKKVAEAGYPEGMCRLAIFYDIGRGVEKNSEVAKEWRTKALARGDTKVYTYFDVRYLNSAGFPFDLQCLGYHRNPEPPSTFPLNIKRSSDLIAGYFFRCDYGLAIQFLQHQISVGSRVAAIYFLSTFSGKRDDFPSDVNHMIREAIDIATRDGSDEAKFALASYYINAEDEKEVDKALDLLRDQNHAEVLTLIGKYHYRKGVSNLREAVKFYSRALEVDANCANALAAYGFCKLNGLGTLPHPEEGFKCLKRAFEIDGHPKAAAYLGVCYAIGEGVAIDLQEAVRLLAFAESFGVPTGIRSAEIAAKIKSGSGNE